MSQTNATFGNINNNEDGYHAYEMPNEEMWDQITPDLLQYLVINQIFLPLLVKEKVICRADEDKIQVRSNEKLISEILEALEFYGE